MDALPRVVHLSSNRVKIAATSCIWPPATKLDQESWYSPALTSNAKYIVDYINSVVHWLKSKYLLKSRSAITKRGQIVQILHG